MATVGELMTLLNSAVLYACRCSALLHTYRTARADCKPVCTYMQAQRGLFLQLRF